MCSRFAGKRGKKNQSRTKEEISSRRHQGSLKAASDAKSPKAPIQPFTRQRRGPRKSSSEMNISAIELVPSKNELACHSLQYATRLPRGRRSPPTAARSHSRSAQSALPNIDDSMQQSKTHEASQTAVESPSSLPVWEVIAPRAMTSMAPPRTW